MLCGFASISQRTFCSILNKSVCKTGNHFGKIAVSSLCTFTTCDTFDVSVALHDVNNAYQLSLTSISHHLTGHEKGRYRYHPPTPLCFKICLLFSVLYLVIKPLAFIDTACSWWTVMHLLRLHYVFKIFNGLCCVFKIYF